jgi:hypothetical protein
LQHYFRLHSSGIFSALLLFGYSLAIAIVFLLPISAWFKIALCLLLSASLSYHLLRDAWLLLPVSCVAIRFEGGDVMLVTRAGKEISGNLARSSVVTPMLTVLNVLPAGKTSMQSVVIFPDSMKRERFRELRVLLKWANNIRV